MKQAKAQVFSADAVFSLMIFFAAASIAFFLWVYVQPADATARGRAEGIADYLMMERLGAENRLDSSMIDNFSSQAYGGMKSELDIPDDFYFNITDMSSSVIKYGGLAPQNANYAVNVRRIGSLNGSYVYLDTILWK